MSVHPNPCGREYTPAEIAAAKRRGLLDKRDIRAKVLRGPLIYAMGPWYPTDARRQARAARKAAADWDLLADAMDREWQKPLPTPKETR